MTNNQRPITRRWPFLLRSEPEHLHERDPVAVRIENDELRGPPRLRRDVTLGINHPLLATLAVELMDLRHLDPAARVLRQSRIVRAPEVDLDRVAPHSAILAGIESHLEIEHIDVELDGAPDAGDRQERDPASEVGSDHAIRFAFRIARARRILSVSSLRLRPEPRCA